MKIARTLQRPVITEKSTMLNEENRYVFEVDQKATKYDIARACRVGVRREGCFS